MLTYLINEDVKNRALRYVLIASIDTAILIWLSPITTGIHIEHKVYITLVMFCIGAVMLEVHWRFKRWRETASKIGELY